MRCGIAFSSAGAEALLSVGRLDLVVARGGTALIAARAHGLPATSADSLIDATAAEQVDFGALVAAREWRPGPLSPEVTGLDIGVLAEYDLLHVGARILRLAAAISSLEGVRELVVAAGTDSPEALTAASIARAKGWSICFVGAGTETCPPLDIAAPVGRPVPLGRRWAKYALARVATVGRGRGDRVAAYVSGEALPLLCALAAQGAVRPVLDPAEPPARAALAGRALRGAAWAGRSPSRLRTRARSALPAPPALTWRGVDLREAMECGLERVVAPHLGEWKDYAGRLLKAWRRAALRAVILINDCTPSGRVRALVAAHLGVPSIVVQHGVLGWIADRNHEVADYSAVWGPLVREDLAARGIAEARVGVCGWPVANHRMPEAKRLRTARLGDFGLVLTTNLALGTARFPEDSVEVQLLNALGAIRAGGWRGRVIAKIHPSQETGAFRRMLAEGGHSDVEVAEGESDPWPLMAVARFAVTASSSIACALPHLGCPAVVHDEVRSPYAPYLSRFREFAVASAADELQVTVASLIRGEVPSNAGVSTVRVADYASIMPDGDTLFAAIVRTAVRDGPVGVGAAQRALQAHLSRPVAFDYSPLRSSRPGRL